MAQTGVFFGTTTNGYIQPKITWSAQQDVARNDSLVVATLSYSRTNSGYATAGQWSGSLTIGGSTAQGTASLRITQDSDTVAITHSVRVPHDDYGNAHVEISATGGIAGSSLTRTDIGAAVTLNSIARASGISATDGLIGGRSTVVVSRKNDGFSHSIAYRFGTQTGYIDASGNSSEREVIFRDSTVNFLLPESFYHQIPNKKSDTCTLTCRTYSGSTRIGSDQTASFTVAADQTLCAPVVTGSVRDTNLVTNVLTGSQARFVRGLSTAQCTLTAQARNGASIVEQTIDGVVPEGDSLVIENIESQCVTFRAKDSRGFVSTCQVTLNMVPYVRLTNNATVRRTDPTGGNAELTFRGSCFCGSFGAIDNALDVCYQVGSGQEVWQSLQIEPDHTYRLSIPLSGLDYASTHQIRVTVRDFPTTVTRTLTLQRGIPVFDWGREDFRFHVPVEVPELTVGGIVLQDYIRAALQAT